MGAADIVADDMAVQDCQIDCTYSWRPGFSDSISRLRIARFPEHVLISNFIDADEGNTGLDSAIRCEPSATWRDVASAILNEQGFSATYAEDWVCDAPLASLSNLTFKQEPNTATKVFALAWIGAGWSDAAKRLIKRSDDELMKLDQGEGLLTLAGHMVDAIECGWREYEGYLETDDFFDQMIEGELAGVASYDVAERLIQEGLQEE